MIIYNGPSVIKIKVMKKIYYSYTFIICAILFGLTISELPSWGATYYMRAGGTAANKGAASGPCGTQANTMSIATHDAETFSADDIISLCDDGGVYRDQMDIPSSGSDGSPIIYQAATGDTPIINGADIIETWTAVPPGNTNLVANPEAINLWNAANTTVGTNVATPLSLHGTQTVESITVEDADNETHQVHVELGGSATTVYTFSIYAQPDYSDWIKLQLTYYDAGWGYLDNSQSYFDITNGNLGASYNISARSITSVGDEWYRISISQTTPVNTVYIGYSVFLASADSTDAFVGDNSKIYTHIWGGKFEQAAAPSTYDNTNRWQATLTTEPNQIFFNEVIGTKVASVDICYGTGKWYWAANVLYIYYTEDPDGAVIIEASTRDHGVDTNDKSYLTITGLNVTMANIRGIYVGGTYTSILVDENTISKSFAAGIVGRVVTSPGTGLTITNNTVTENGIGVGGNGAYPPHGIGIQGADSSNYPTNTVISENLFDGNHYGIESGYFADSILISSNKVLNSVESGIQIDGGRTTIISYNLVYSNNTVGIKLLNYEAGGWGSQTGNSILGNVIYYNGTGLSVESEQTNLTIENNILNNNTNIAYWQKEIYLGNYTFTGLIMDYNLYYQAGGGTYFSYDGSGPGDGDTATNFAGWKTQFGQDANSLNSDPLMTDPANGDFTLQPISSAIDAGTDPHVNGDGDQYDYARELVWDDTLDAPVGAWANGVEMGAYGFNTGCYGLGLGLCIGL